MALRRRILRQPIDPPFARSNRLLLAYTWAARGAWDSAVAALDENARLDAATDTLAPLRAYRVAVLGAWLGALPATEATRRRSAGARAARDLGPTSMDEIAWLDGLLAATRRDRGALGAARRALRASQDSGAVYLDRSLGAFELSLAGDTRKAATAMAALEWGMAEQWYPERWNRPAAMPVDRLAASQWLLAAGDTTQAARLLTWVDADFPSSGYTGMVHALVELERGRIEDALGHGDLAREHYKEFLLRYDLPTGLHRHLVQEATAAVARLSRRPPNDPP